MILRGHFTRSVWRCGVSPLSTVFKGYYRPGGVIFEDYDRWCRALVWRGSFFDPWEPTWEEVE